MADPHGVKNLLNKRQNNQRTEKQGIKVIHKQQEHGQTLNDSH